MISEYLSEAELYYSTAVTGNLIKISGDELYHMAKVMRHSSGSEIWVTSGKGEIYLCRIEKTGNDFAELVPLKKFSYNNETDNIILCIPYLKNNDRLETALEKCTELGTTHFIIYTSERTIPRTPKIERWNKIVLSAMKQSLRSYLPEIKFYSLSEINRLEGEKLLFDQKAEVQFSRSLITNKQTFLIIGPEGGFSPGENQLFKGSSVYKLAPNRLRSETAAIVCASFFV